MGPPELVIFDCDGVLVDSEVISNTVLAEALGGQGLATTLSEARRDYQGLPLGGVVVGAGRRLGRALPAEWLAEYERRRAEAFRRELHPVAGAREAVQLVAGAGVAVCVASQGGTSTTRPPRRGRWRCPSSTTGCPVALSPRRARRTACRAEPGRR